MKRLIAKEVRDLAPVALVGAAASAATGWIVGTQQSFPLPGLALLCAACGATVGVTQGLFDRRRRDDPFLLHRPVSPVRLHALRGVAGAAIAATLAALAVVAARVATWETTLTQGAVAANPWLKASLERTDPGLADSFACVAGAVVLHAIVRLAMTPRRPLVAATLLVVLPVTVIYALLSIETASAPWLVLAAIAGAASALSSLQLVGRSA